MEQRIKRPLERNEVVHHINGNKRDNRLENLQLMTNSDHARLHLTGKPLTSETKKKLSEANSGRPRPDRWTITKEQAMSAKERHNSGESWRSIGLTLNCHHKVAKRAVDRFEAGQYALKEATP